ncbi:hypothetical protein QAD02_010194 [Eretmocerus hayati]|uniref:Uncharacterized protein n=1 Tax=Eretmocerus hayati TaxID=131215 RepID=A0ACC2NCU0_9HYME|nr:hypothetical protein QAD02_010194 [Eretmocerus hayati]
MSAATASFDSWLIDKLQQLNTDEGVFGSYIRGILEGDESHDEKTEALESILAGITEDEIGKHVSEILEAWSKFGLVKLEKINDAPKEDVDVRLARMLESQKLATTSHKSSHTEEERRIKEAILAQYSQMSDEEESEDEDNEDPGGGGGCSGGGGDSGLAKNTNVSDIVRAQKEQRERAKLESQRKKDKDKEDREKQKLAKEEKKEKRKTHKGERRR